MEEGRRSVDSAGRESALTNNQPIEQVDYYMIVMVKTLIIPIKLDSDGSADVNEQTGRQNRLL